MGAIPTGHLKEIKELEIVIEPPSCGEKSTKPKQRPRNSMRSATERAWNVEKKEKLNKE